MKEPLKPVSEALRKALALLGETPEQHQAEVLARKSGGKASASPRSHKLPPDPKLTPAAEIAARWESHNWRPIARVMFLREAHCRHCGQTSMSAHWPETFIKERMVKDPKSFRYLPAKSSVAASVKLPHQTETLKLTTAYCPQCFLQSTCETSEPTQCLEDLLISQLAATASSQSRTNTATHGSTSPASSALESCSVSPKLPMLDSYRMDPDWSQTSLVNLLAQRESARGSGSPEVGYIFASCAFDLSALAKPTISPTMQAREPVMSGPSSATESEENT